MKTERKQVSFAGVGFDNIEYLSQRNSGGVPAGRLNINYAALSGCLPDYSVLSVPHRWTDGAE
jgi:hypothetical protein